MRNKEGETDFERMFKDSIKTGEFKSSLQKNVKSEPHNESLSGSKNRPRLSKKRLKKTRVKHGGTLDLHGLTEKEARLKLGQFIRNARTNRINVIEVITGRGNHSQAGPVLKPMAESLFQSLLGRREIIAYILENNDGSYIVQLYN